MTISISKRKNSLLFMTGYMGAGKSTIGRKLAFKLGYRFMDTDKTLEKYLHKKMSEIFADVGEAGFRQQEENLIERTTRKSRYVVSTGGGTLTRTETFYTAQRAGLIIYLKAPVEVLFERVIFSQKDRPLIDIPDAEEQFEKRFKLREPFYMRADFTVETFNRTTDEVVEDIVEWLQKQS